MAGPGPVSATDARPSRAARADAVRNRAALVTAAAEVLAEQGLGADVREIARRAGVGMGTLYRHFPTKEDLVEEALDVEYARWGVEARTAAEADADPWHRLAGFVESCVERQIAHRALAETWHARMEAARGPGGTAPAGAPDLADLAGAVLGEAQRAGVVRAGLTRADLMLMTTATAQCAMRPGCAGDDVSWRRALHVYLDGLRSTHVEALPGA